MHAHWTNMTLKVFQLEVLKCRVSILTVYNEDTHHLPSNLHEKPRFQNHPSKNRNVHMHSQKKNVSHYEDGDVNIVNVLLTRAQWYQEQMKQTSVKSF